jgi:HK97 family phage major capsid protein
MARATFEDWIPEEKGGPVIRAITAGSAVESLARREPMASETKSVPRMAGMTFAGAIAKGAAYPEDESANDDVVLRARKLGKVLRVADEDLQDTAQVANIIQAKQLDWARSYAIGFDNATLGTTAVANGTTVPFNSVLYALTQNNTDTGYTANANITETDGALALADLEAAVGGAEESNFYSEQDMVVIAHPAFKALLRGLATANDNVVIVDGLEPRLFGIPVRWSLGARTHATATDSPTGDPLLVVGNRQLLILGDRSGPEYMLSPADSGAAFLTDEALLKVRTRRGFAVGNENAFHVVRITAS